MKVSRFNNLKVKDLVKIGILLGFLYVAFRYVYMRNEDVSSETEVLQKPITINTKDEKSIKINTKDEEFDSNDARNDRLLDKRMNKDNVKGSKGTPKEPIRAPPAPNIANAASDENKDAEARRKNDEGQTQNQGGEVAEGMFRPEMLNITNPFDLKVRPPFLRGYRNPCWLEAPDATVRCLPYFLLIGMMKCGTTDLYQRLMVHPRVVAPNSRRWEVEESRMKFDAGERNWKSARWAYKEPHYWSSHWVSGRTLDSYVSLFDGAAEVINRTLMMDYRRREMFHATVTFDASTSTFWDNTHWKKNPDNAGLEEPKYLNPHYLRHVLPDVKLLLSLRNPVNRLFSEYKFLRRTSIEGMHALTPNKFHEYVKEGLKHWEKCLIDKTFTKCLYSPVLAKDGLLRGMYAHLLKPWLEVFPREQIAIIKFEEYTKNTLTKLKAIYKFLKLDALPVQLENVVLNYPVENEITDKSRMLDETRSLLEEFYRPYNKQLATLLQDDRFLWEDY